MIHSSKFRYIVLSLLAIVAGFSVWYVRSAIQAAITRKSAGVAGGLEQGLVGYWSFDEDAGTVVPDHSGQGNTGTATNGPVGTTGVLGRALQFDGVSNYVNAGTGSSINFERTNSFTISAWIKSTLTHNGFIAAKQGGGAPDFQGYGFLVRSDGNLYAEILHSGGTDGIIVTGNTQPITANQWYHAVMTYNGSSSASGVKFYVNGVNVPFTTNVDALALSIQSTEPLRIGVRGNSSGFYVGSIDDVRIYNRALTASEITRLYNQAGKVTQGVSPVHTLASGLVGYWTMDASSISGTSMTDRSGNGNTGTLTNGPTPTLGKIGQALQFDGVSNYVSMGNTTNFDLTTLTLSAWIYPTVDSGAVFSDRWNYNGGSNWNWSLLLGGTKNLRFIGGATGSTGVYTNNNVLTINAWNHIVMVMTPTSLQYYINGVADTNTNNGSPTYNNSDARPVVIGARNNTATTFNGQFSGRIDDVRIYNRALSATEVSQLYTLGQPKINASQNNRLTSGLVGLWSFNGPDISGTTAYDRSGQGNNGTLTNGPTPVIGKIGQALQFDGVNDYVSVGTTGLPSGAGARTMAAWFYPPSPATTGYVMSYGDNPGSVGSWSAIAFLNTQVIQCVGKSANLNSVSTITLNQWHHVVCSYDGTNWRVYIDGSLEATGAATLNTVVSVAYIGVRPTIAQYYTGPIDDVRVYNRALSASEVQQLYNMGR